MKRRRPGRRKGARTLAALALLALLVAWALQLRQGPSPSPFPSPPGGYVPVGSLHQFHAAEAGGLVRVSYGFLDHHGRRQQVACTIRREDYEREVRSFGYAEEEMWPQLNRTLAERIAAEGRQRGLAPYYRIEVYGRTGYRWRWEVPGGLDPGAERRLLAAARDFDAWLDREARRLGDEMIAAYYRDRGLRLAGNHLKIDYDQIVRGATEPLGDCFQALWRAGLEDDDRRLLGLFLAFFQELRYEIPPEEEHGRRTLGFRVPTAVLARGAGDCDSKSAAFCALWRNFRSPVLLVLVPGHALIGVEGRPRAGEAHVRLGNRYFVLCEVSGPAKIPPGGRRISGSFEYVLIEPLQAAAARAGAAP